MPLYLCSQDASKKRRPLSPAVSGFAVLVEQDDVFRRFGETHHVVADPRDLRAQRRLILRRIDVFGLVRPDGPALQLPAPDAAEVHVVLAVGVLEDRRVDAVAALDGSGRGRERAGRVVADRRADTKDVLLVLYRKVQVVLAGLFGRVRRPHLPPRPRHILDVERDAVIGDRPPTSSIENT